MSIRRPGRGAIVPAVLVLVAGTLGVRGATLEVAADGSGDHTTIQAAIDAAIPCVDDVLVRCGVYTETIVMRSGVPVRGQRAACAVLDGGGTGPVVDMAGVSASTELREVTVRNGVAPRGAGILVTGGAPVITRTIIADNRATDFGGGVWVDGYPDPEGTAPSIRYNVFRDNTAQYGGGIEVYSAGGTRVAGNLFVRNSASAGGGAISLYRAPAEVVGNTIVNNADEGVSVSVSDALVAGNVVAWNGSSGITVYDSNATFETNDVHGHTTNWSGTPDPTGTAGNVSVDPQLIDMDGDTFFDAQPRSSSPILEPAAIPSSRVGDLSGLAAAAPGIAGAPAHADIGARDNEGITGLRFDSTGTLSWDLGRHDTVDHNVYRGSLSRLAATGEYTQDPSVVPQAAVFCERTGSLPDDGAVPPSGEALFYLVVGWSSLGEGTLGYDSARVERPASYQGCPPPPS